MEMTRKICHIFLSIVIAMTIITAPCIAFADDVENQPESVRITAIEALNGDIAFQDVILSDEFVLPDSIRCRAGESEQYIEIEVLRWVDEDGKTALGTDSYDIGRHIFRPVLNEKYILDEGVDVPTVEIDVIRLRTSVSGKNLSPEKKAGTTLTDTVTVKNAGARKLYLQRFNGEEWVTSKSFKTTDEASQTVKITYPSDWWKNGEQLWRIRIYEKGRYAQYTSSTITTTPVRYYQMPSQYFQLSDGVVLDESGGYTLYKGYMGFKTRIVNSYFGIGDYHWPRYTQETRNKVREFQKKHGLKETGNCNRDTWFKLGEVEKKKRGRTSFTEYNWYEKSAYVHHCEIDMSYTRTECVEQFIKTAYEYLGDPYVVGASGKPGQGCDCSGLVMQACYSCGIDLSPTSVVRHAKPAYEYESRTLYKSSRIKKVSWSDRKKGDLVFYDNNGVIMHVAIYLGNNKIIHSWPNKVQVSSVYGWGHIAGVKRIFS